MLGIRGRCCERESCDRAGGGGATGRATVSALAATCLTVVAVDGSEAGLRDLPDGVRLEVADTTDPAVTAGLVDRIAAEVGRPTCW
jgi:NAD(P)-dependent dehydrogenase (short-subunit alcohol dehydrogenase family)